MRLDHLLSKEHLAGRFACHGWVVLVQAHARAECVRGGAHGWNIDYGRLVCWWRSSTPAVFGSWGGNGWLRVGGRLGTLLGPEGTAGGLLLRGRELPAGSGRVGRWWGVAVCGSSWRG